MYSQYTSLLASRPRRNPPRSRPRNLCRVSLAGGGSLGLLGNHLVGDIARQGYVEEEYFISGQAQRYEPIGNEREHTGLFALRDGPRFEFLCVPPLGRAQDVGMATLLVAQRLCRSRQALLVVDPPLAWDSAVKWSSRERFLKPSSSSRAILSCSSRCCARSTSTWSRSSAISSSRAAQLAQPGAGGGIPDTSHDHPEPAGSKRADTPSRPAEPAKLTSSTASHPNIRSGHGT